MTRIALICLAELVGTFLLVFVGTLAIVLLFGRPEGAAALPHLLRLMIVLLSFAAMIALIVHSPIGLTSGAHMNPAVSIALALREAPLRSLLPYYIAMQILGALLGALAVQLPLPAESARARLGITLPHATLPLYGAVAAEFAGTALLMLVIHWAIDHRPRQLGVIVGGYIAVAGFLLAGVSGSSFNPARSLGPALVCGQLEHIWLYLTVPIVGAVVGGLAYSLLDRRP